jgi:hypothetical protein
MGLCWHIYARKWAFFFNWDEVSRWADTLCGPFSSSYAEREKADLRMPIIACYVSLFFVSYLDIPLFFIDDQESSL